ncbi:MAG: hypothetical protein ACLP6E_15875 [Acidimicrobiales bacterium]
MFTDLVGSTELFSSLSPQEADDFRNDHFSLLRGAVSGAGGLEVKSQDDGLMVAFSGLSRGLACAGNATGRASQPSLSKRLSHPGWPGRSAACQ